MSFQVARLVHLGCNSSLASAIFLPSVETANRRVAIHPDQHHVHVH